MSVGNRQMTQSIAQLESERASIYLQQLCKHFAHKLPVEFTPDQGKISFQDGTCLLAASGNHLTMKVEADDADRLARVQDVVERHLVRFAFREQATIEWRAATAAS
jgi:hypothetical protein